MNLVIQLKQPLENFTTSVWVDGLADVVVFGEVFDFIEVVAKTDVLPAVGFENEVVHLDVEVTEFQDTGNGFVEGDGVGCFCKMLVQVCGIFSEKFLKGFFFKKFFFRIYLP